ncbi:DUF3817 domain-containing protein [Sphingopyxis sp.]|jgi:integral membrane protein|uniref:DUF3817 domain-containing protein n=1 Tax=Sphingopyxis sp. TaxID=1908224 RepID=UPI002DE88F1B|nr:DUF3817 domain-containing protein [Sphingopyxis sp.]
MSLPDNQADPAFLRQLRLMAMVEASTLVALLFVAVPLKHLADWPLGVRAIGPIHGLAFLGYIWMLFQGAGAGLFRQRRAWPLVVSAFIPFAGFMTAHRLSHQIGAASPLESNGR